MADGQHERHLASHVFNVVMMLFGAGALVWMLHSLGWDKFRQAVDGLGPTFAICIVLDLIAAAFDARALHAFMRPEARMISYWRVLAAQLSGRAVNVVTPFGAFGEATKLSMLVLHAPRARVLSSIVLFNLATLYFSVGVIMIGTPITLLLIHLPPPLNVVVYIALPVLIALMIALGILVHRGAMSSLTGVLSGLHVISHERRDDWRKKLADVDRHIAELHRNRAAGTWRGILWVIAERLVTWTSTLLLIHALGVHLTPTLVLGYLSIGVLIQWTASIVPMGLGLADGGNYALFGLLGAAGSQGAFVTMLNRARSLGVAMLGFVVMAVVHTTNRVGLARIHRRMDELRQRAQE